VFKCEHPGCEREFSTSKGRDIHTRRIHKKPTAIAVPAVQEVPLNYCPNCGYHLGVIKQVMAVAEGIVNAHR
jgi:hypothetical protein